MGDSRPIEIRYLRKGEESVLGNVADDVFDDPIRMEVARAFLADDRHHLVVALDGDLVVGFASGVHYLHPDQEFPELWVNEVGVAESHQGQGIAKRILARLFETARTELGCNQAWVLTERENIAATRLYASAGGYVSGQHEVMYSFDLKRT